VHQRAAVKRKLDDMLRIGENLNLLVSLDGLGEDHEALRGKGTFNAPWTTSR